MPLLSLFNVKDTTLSDPYQQRLWNFPVDVSIQVWLVKVGHRKPKIWIGLGSCMVNYFQIFHYFCAILQQVIVKKLPSTGIQTQRLSIVSPSHNQQASNLTHLSLLLTSNNGLNHLGTMISGFECPISESIGPLNSLVEGDEQLDRPNSRCMERFHDCTAQFFDMS